MKVLSKKTLVLILAFGFLFNYANLVPVDASIANDANTAKAATQKTMYVKWNKIKMYKKKSTSSGVVATLKKDRKVTIISSVNNGWVKVKLSNGKKGFVKKKQLSAKTFKQRSLASLKAELDALWPEISSAGWEVSFDGEYQWDDRYMKKITIVKDSYRMKFVAFTTLNEDYNDGRIRNRYLYQLFKDGKLQDFSYSSPRSTLIKVLNKY